MHFFDQTKYQALQTQETEITEFILKADRAPPVYYIVIFIGKEMPATLSGKMVIYKELPGTKLGNFVTKIKASFPGITSTSKVSCLFALDKAYPFSDPST